MSIIGAELTIVMPVDPQDTVEVSTVYTDGSSQVLSMDLIDAYPNVGLVEESLSIDKSSRLGVNFGGSYVVSMGGGRVWSVTQSYNPEIATEIREGIIGDIEEQIDSMITGVAVKSNTSYPYRFNA